MTTLSGMTVMGESVSTDNDSYNNCHSEISFSHTVRDDCVWVLGVVIARLAVTTA